MLEFRKLALIAAMVLSVTACTSMLLGNSGTSTGSTRATSTNLQAQVYSRLRESGEYSQVQVIANGSHISLRGQVASAALSKRAETITRSTTGVTSVNNLLNISSD